MPWESMTTPLEQIYQVDKAVVLAGRLAERHFEQVSKEIVGRGGAIEGFGTKDGQRACVVICLAEAFSLVQKVLRTADFEQVNFSGLKPIWLGNASGPSEGCRMKNWIDARVPKLPDNTLTP